jgi:hypothetical protein
MHPTVHSVVGKIFFEQLGVPDIFLVGIFTESMVWISVPKGQHAWSPSCGAIGKWRGLAGGS